MLSGMHTPYSCIHIHTQEEFPSHHNWRSTAGMRDWKNGRQKGKHRTPEEFSFHCDSCLISTLRDYTARKLLETALQSWAQEKSLADAFLNKMEHRSAILKMISFQDKADDSDFRISIRMLLTPLIKLFSKIAGNWMEDCFQVGRFLCLLQICPRSLPLHAFQRDKQVCFYSLLCKVRGTMDQGS